MLTRILICGAGQLGSRYLQGMVRCTNALRIFVYDLDANSLNNVINKWNEILNSYNHEVIFVNSLEEVEKQIDIAIVSTSSNARVSATQKICKIISVEHWIFEKVLTQNEVELDELISLVGDSKAWVNTPRRMMDWYREIKKSFDFNGPIKFTLRGGSWGMACNTIHFLDLFSWWSDESIELLSVEKLNNDWYMSKRNGFWEIFGKITAQFSNGSIAEIISDDSNDPVLIKVASKYDQRISHSWTINEFNGIAKRSDELIINGKIDYQSEMTPVLIDSIISNGDCNLPSLKISAELHRIYISKMLEHWTRTKDPDAKSVPIT